MGAGVINCKVSPDEGATSKDDELSTPVERKLMGGVSKYTESQTILRGREFSSPGERRTLGTGRDFRK